MATRVDTAGGVNEETLLLRAAKHANKNRDTIIVIDGIVNMVGAERQKERKREREREREQKVSTKDEGRYKMTRAANPSRERVVLTLQQSLFVKRIRFVMRKDYSSTLRSSWTAG
jgi:hypothetical protein